MIGGRKQRKTNVFLGGKNPQRSLTPVGHKNLDGNILQEVATGENSSHL